jgi:adenylate cyclase
MRRMAKVERERKFLVRGDGWRGVDPGALVRQAYLSTDPDRSVRVRTIGDRAWLTIKGRARGAERAELEYEIPFEDAPQIFSLAKGHLVEKRRHRVEHRGAIWEVDEFSGDNAGLVTAEIELEDPEALERAVRDRPDWVGRELTEDHRFSNNNLAERPISRWPASERSEALSY